MEFGGGGEMVSVVGRLDGMDGVDGVAQYSTQYRISDGEPSLFLHILLASLFPFLSSPPSSLQPFI